MIEGRVVKLIDDKTVKVAVVVVYTHPLYNKVIRQNKVVLCHLDKILVELGGRVFIKSCRPYSKTKKHIVIKKIDV